MAYICIQGIGIAAVDVLAEHTAKGVWSVLGGGLLGGLALVVIALASIGSGAMTVYGASLALQTIGVRVRRPESRPPCSTAVTGCCARCTSRPGNH